MASLTDILTASQNIATAINNWAQTSIKLAGLQSTSAISTATVLKTGSGRVATVIVTTAGAAGAIYDTAAASSTANIIYVIPNTLGVYVLNFPVTNGIVVAPGAAQVVSVSFS